MINFIKKIDYKYLKHTFYKYQDELKPNEKERNNIKRRKDNMINKFIIHIFFFYEFHYLE